MRKALFIALLALVVAGGQEVILDAQLLQFSTLNMPEGQVDLPGIEDCNQLGSVFYPNNDTLVFQDDSDQSACAGIAYNETAPAGVSQVRISLEANRHVITPVTQGFVANNFVQRIRILDTQGVESDSREIFSSLSGDSEFREVEFSLNLPANPDYQIVFEFADLSPGISIPDFTGVGPAWSGTIRDVLIEYPAVSVPIGVTERLFDEVTDEEIIQHHRLAINIPQSAYAGGAAAIQFTVASDAVIPFVELPNDSNLNESQLSVAQSGNLRILTILPTQFAGPGVYQVHFLTTAELPPPPAPPEPLRAPWIPYLYLAIPLVAILAATIGHTLTERSASSMTVLARTGLRATLVLLWLALALGGLVLVFVDGLFQEVQILPPTSRVQVYLVTLAALTIFAVIYIAFDTLRRRTAFRLERANEISEMNKELSRSNRDLAQFASVASHDLQEPLRKVASYTELLKNRYDQQLDPKGRSYLERANNASIRARTLISDVLQYSRLGQSPVKKENLELAVVVSEVLETTKLRCEEVGAKVQLRAQGTIFAQQSLVAQVLSNLVVNSCKYRDESRKPVIQISYVDQKGYDCIRFSDNGIGIREESQAKIFELFGRAHQKEADTSTGLGLSICHRIMELHGGEISVVSAVGKGTTFMLRFPKR